MFKLKELTELAVKFKHAFEPALVATDEPCISHIFCYIFDVAHIFFQKKIPPSRPHKGLAETLGV